MRTVLLFLMLAVPTHAADEPKPAPTQSITDGIRFPVRPLSPSPLPAEPVSRLGMDQLLVIEVDFDCMITTSPLDVVAVTQGPPNAFIVAKFVDGDGTYQEKTCTAKKAVYIVRAKKTGRVEIIVIPGFAKSDKEFRRETLSVDASPTPEPVSSNLEDNLRAALKFESDADKALLKNLAEVYRAGVSLASKELTWGSLFKAMSAKAKERGVEGKLLKVQGVIQIELGRRLPVKNAGEQSITADGQEKAKQAFEYIAKTLDDVSK